MVFTLTIATFVTIVDRVLAAHMYQMSKTLGPYIPLIIVNCIIICHCEVVASRQSVAAAAADALGQSAGFALTLGSQPPCVNFLVQALWPAFKSFQMPGQPG